MTQQQKAEQTYDQAIDDFLAKGVAGWVAPQDPLTNLQVATYHASLALIENAKAMGVQA